ncbi:MAG: cytochrome C oxidase subunit IV family protein [Candidatus Dadabacteria bacterium]|nr:cytochrome C oxidase subunit IV family protein [Candidatus Dadabacteria bacterium]
MSTHDHNEEHHTGLRVYGAVCLTLFVLTAVTVYITKFDFGDMNIVVAMIIASIKAGIVALYFMHLKFEDKLTWIYALYPLFLLFLLIGFTIIETFTRVPVIR